jgi:hypothetical protein
VGHNGGLEVTEYPGIIDGNRIQLLFKFSGAKRKARQFNNKFDLRMTLKMDHHDFPQIT